MAINWADIEGYNEEMTAEEKLALLDKADLTPKNVIGKTMFDKLSSDYASLKKQYREKLTDEEKHIADQKAMQDELETLKRDKVAAEYKASLKSLNFDDETANEAVKSLQDGDVNNLFSVLKRQQEAQEKALRAEIMRGTPGPNGTEKDDNPENKETEAVKAARRLGREQIESHNRAQEILKKYI